LTPVDGFSIVLDNGEEPMRSTRYVLFLAAGILAGARPTRAHHSLASEYDLNRSITVTGTVTRLEWGNPHVHLYLNTIGSGATDVMHWELEMASPNLLYLSGLKIDSLRIGDHVTVSAHPARDGSNVGYAQKISHSPH
jgi:hypothetical protein